MKKYFWARYYRATGGLTKTGRTSNNQYNRDLSQEAQFWKAMALMKTGSKITIPERRFAGKHPAADGVVKNVVDDSVMELNKSFEEELKRK